MIDIPTYKLYGENEAWPTPDMVHCESIAERSRLHDWHIKPHQHGGLFQILYLQHGTADVHLDGQSGTMTGGDLLLVPQNTIHGFRFNSDTEGHVLTLAYPLLHRLTRDIGMSGLSLPGRHRIGTDDDSVYLRSTLDAFVREYRSTALHRNLLVETLLLTILIGLSRCLNGSHLPGQRSRQDSPHFARFCALVEAWYGKHYPLERYAAEIGITTAHLNLLCRRMEQKSALALIHERLLLEAKRSLIYTAMTVSELSYAIGFSDPAYFTRFFKRATGESPTRFRSRIEQLRSDGQDH
jgi:AraC family transcriptional activator of pobA